MTDTLYTFGIQSNLTKKLFTQQPDPLFGENDVNLPYNELPSFRISQWTTTDEDENLHFPCPNTGHYLMEFGLELRFPKIDNIVSGTYAKYIPNVGIAAIDKITFKCKSNNLIFSEFDHFLIDILKEYRSKNGSEDSFIGSIEPLTTIQTPGTSSELSCFIKIPFWFNTNAFPIYLFQTNRHHLTMSVVLKSLDQLVTYDGMTAPTVETPIQVIPWFKMGYQAIPNELEYHHVMTDYHWISDIRSNEPICTFELGDIFLMTQCIYIVCLLEDRYINNDYNNNGLDTFKPLISSIRLFCGNTTIVPQTPELVLRAQLKDSTSRYLYKIPFDTVCDFPNGTQLEITMNTLLPCRFTIYNERLNHLSYDSEKLFSKLIVV